MGSWFKRLSSVTEPWQMTVEEYAAEHERLGALVLMQESQENNALMVSDEQKEEGQRLGLPNWEIFSRAARYPEEAIENYRQWTKLTGYEGSPLGGGPTPGSRYSHVTTDHMRVIKRAIREGKPVSPEVMAHYPDLWGIHENM